VGLSHVVVGETKAETSVEDTQRTAEMMADEHVDLLAFCGGDGTARDLLGAVDQKIAILGVPAGVKMQSGVFASTPREAAQPLRSDLSAFEGFNLVFLLVQPLYRLTIFGLVSIRHKVPGVLMNSSECWEGNRTRLFV
jgi:hypothetical protein